MLEQETSPQIIIPQDVWDKSALLTPAEKNIIYPPMAYLFRSFGKTLDQYDHFSGDIQFSDTQRILRFDCSPDRVAIDSLDSPHNIKLSVSPFVENPNELVISGLMITRFNHQHHPNLYAKSVLVDSNSPSVQVLFQKP